MASSLTSTRASAGDRGQRLLGLGTDLVAQRAAGHGQDDGRADALVVHDDVAHHAQLDDAALQLGVLDRREGSFDVVVSHGLLRS